MPRTEKQLEAIIRPMAQARYEADFLFGGLEGSLQRLGEDFGGLELTPDFQRGHVWTPDQKRHFIENLLRGIISTSGLTIQFNCPQFEENSARRRDQDLPNHLQCIDGLQRLTAVLDFLRGEVQPFGLNRDDLVNYRPQDTDLGAVS